LIEFFLNPQRVKALLIGGGSALAMAVSLLIGCIYLSGRLDAERADHKTTRLQRDNAVTEGLRWKKVAEDAGEKQATLREAASECLAREKEAREDAAERTAIMRRTVPRERTEMEKKGVIDDATRRKAVDRLNRPL